MHSDLYKIIENKDIELGLENRLSMGTKLQLYIMDNAIPDDLAFLLNEMNEAASDPVAIEANHTLLRNVSRFQAVDKAIDEKLGEDSPIYNKIKQEIKQTFKHRLMSVLGSANQPGKTNSDKLKAIKENEIVFNTFLIKKLHEANLTNGRTTTKEAVSLLSFFSKKTEKDNTVDAVDFLEKPSALAVMEYKDNLMAYRNSLSRHPVDSLLRRYGQKILNEVEDIAGENPAELYSTELYDLNMILLFCNKTLTPGQTNESRLANINTLHYLAKKAYERSSFQWKKLGDSIMAYATYCAIAIVVCVALSVVGLGLPLAFGGAIGLASLGLYYAESQEKGLLKAVGEYKDILITEEPSMVCP